MPPRSSSRRLKPSSKWVGFVKIVALIVVLGFVWFVANVGALGQYVQALRKRDSIARQVADLRAEVERMEKEKGQLRESGEKPARERFHYVMPGESLILLEQETPTRETSE
ncbi:MAG: hypothetical protein NTW86_17890 [Candidatus Sumerlaeota bacterium]|nr:hypothetical protein [Candidatus Sumerlaeota bacterium]